RRTDAIRRQTHPRFAFAETRPETGSPQKTILLANSSRGLMGAILGKMGRFGGRRAAGFDGRADFANSIRKRGKNRPRERYQGVCGSPLREPLRSRFYGEGEPGRAGDVKES